MLVGAVGTTAAQIVTVVDAMLLPTMFTAYTKN
jgi:hypothetical protein